MSFTKRLLVGGLICALPTSASAVQVTEASEYRDNGQALTVWGVVRTAPPARATTKPAAIQVASAPKAAAAVVPTVIQLAAPAPTPPVLASMPAALTTAPPKAVALVPTPATSSPASAISAAFGNAATAAINTAKAASSRTLAWITSIPEQLLAAFETIEIAVGSSLNTAASTATTAGSNSATTATGLTLDAKFSNNPAQLADTSPGIVAPGATVPGLYNPAPAQPAPEPAPPLAPPPAPETAPESGSFAVSSAAELSQALSEAQAGDTIRLASGNYGDFSFAKKQFPGGLVRIISADVSRPAKFSSLNLSNTSGILVGGIQVSGTKTPLVNISTADNIVLTGIRFTGATSNRDPWDDEATAVWIRNSSRVTLYSNSFSDLKLTAFIQRSENVTLARNLVSHVREGFNIAATSKLRLEGNHFHSFMPNYAKGEHPDAIQFWTSNETVGSTNVTLKNNFFQFGGARAVQGIFARSEVAESGKTPGARHADWVVTGNIYYGSSRHGIALNSIDRARVENNIVAASPWADQNNSVGADSSGRTSGGLQPWIKVGATRNSIVRNNAAMLYSDMDTGVDLSNNLDIYDSKMKKGEDWTAILASRPTADLPPASALRTNPGSTAARQVIGVVTLGNYGQSASAISALLGEAVNQHRAAA